MQMDFVAILNPPSMFRSALSASRTMSSCCLPFASWWMPGQLIVIDGSLPFSTDSGGAPDQPAVNRKRVHRIMANHAMILEKHTAVRKGRVHDGKVMVMRSNLRWCSDGLEFTCWNGEVVRLAFIIDAFNRMISVSDQQPLKYTHRSITL